MTQTIWNGPPTSFPKAAFADSTDAANQDLTVPGIAITRADNKGIFNAAVENSYAGGSPSGTEWAVGTTQDIESITFDTWNNTVGVSSTVSGLPNALNIDVRH